MATRKTTTKAVVIKNYDIDKPSQLSNMAVVLKRHIVGHKLYTPIMGKNYAHVEGWQFAGGMLGLFPKVVNVENLSSGSEIKWKAEVEIIDRKSNEVVSSGFAVCSSKESNKKGFDEYAVLSMAQTRAIGKAYRNMLGWVMKLAGYESTPSEEMVKVDEKAPEPNGEAKEKTAPKADYVCAWSGKGGCGADLTKQEHDYSKRIYGRALCREHQKTARAKKK